MFRKLFQEFTNTKAEFYREREKHIGGLKIHVPIPTMKDTRSALAALIYGCWGGTHLGQPVKVLRINDKGAEYIEYREETEDLKQWIGPSRDSVFEDNEEKLLQMSIPVFDLYLTDSKNDLVREYAQRFVAITPVEFRLHYRKFGRHFLEWLELE